MQKLYLWIVLLGSTGISLAQEPVVDAPLPPIEAAQAMKVPEGFRVSLFAGEPDVRQPIGFCIDDRGRLWVAEAYSYPVHNSRPANDRILIFEDTNANGQFDKRTVFYDRLNYVTGIEIGFGGAWVMSPPYFYFIPDRDRDDVPDSSPVVLLDGFGNHANSHNIANGFAWGLDGWLYGTHGRTNFSKIGKPGATENERTQFDGGVYRYHPTQHIWEPYADGTTNPWGIDWNEYGEGFVCNCVNPHLFHVIQGAHYEPWRNRESSQFAYKRIDTIADHLHFVGKQNVRDGLGSHEEDAAGGGHAHCGTMVYQGDNWPDKYRNQVFMNNIHGKRVNQDFLQRSGSGYVASHAPDVIRSQDPWHMGVTLQYGPDGGVFLLDWSDTGECHSVRNTRRETGRIFKITFGTPTTKVFDVAQKSNQELVDLHLHRNEWFVRHARRVLQERAARGEDLSQAKSGLLQLFGAAQSTPDKLRAFWTMHALGCMDENYLLTQTRHPDEHIRAWSIRFLCEGKKPSATTLSRMASMAQSDPSPVVRLYLCCAAQRIKPDLRWDMLHALMMRKEDVQDANVPLMIWYAFEPLVQVDLNRFIASAALTEIPLVREHIARRALSSKLSEESLNGLLASIEKCKSPEAQADILRGTLKGLEGVRSVPMPASWPNLWSNLRKTSHKECQQLSMELALVFNDPTALEILQSQAKDRNASTQDRQRAIVALISKKHAPTAEMLLQFIDDPAVQRPAIRGLAEFEHPAVVPTLLDRFASLDPASQQDALQTLSSRHPWAIRLMDAIESQKVSTKTITAFTVRQIQSLNDPELNRRLKKAWGEFRDTPGEKAKRIADLKRRLTPAVLNASDRSAGRLLFQKHCSACHRIFDAGGSIGPDITGAQRTNVDYLLENLVDPSATVARDFQIELVQTTDARVLTGIVVDENDQAVTLQTVNERVIVPKNEIENRKPSQSSLMPDGILEPLSFVQIRDLFGYLSGPSQVPLAVHQTE